jgi:hypothetical protein
MTATLALVALVTGVGMGWAGTELHGAWARRKAAWKRERHLRHLLKIEGRQHMLVVQRNPLED